LDTGSHVSLLKSTLANKLNLSLRDTQPGELSFLFAAEGSKLHVNGIADITFNVSGVFISHSVYVVSNLSEALILGSDFMSENQVIIDYANRSISLGLCADLERTQLVNAADNSVWLVFRNLCAFPLIRNKSSVLNAPPNFKIKIS